MKIENPQSATTNKSSDPVINGDNPFIKKSTPSLAIPSVSQETNEKIDRILTNLHNTNVEGKNTDQNITGLFQQEFTSLAQNKESFHKSMKEIFGKDYNQTKAEDFRLQALAGDFSWLPKVQYVEGSTLQGNNGAYNADDNVIYINKELKNTPLAARTFVEEAGHSLDKKLNKKDAVGDEGEFFRRTLSGEKLTAAQKVEIRADNDHGTITVHGKKVQVEFWNPLKAIGHAIKKAAKAIGHAAKKVVKSVVSTGKSIFKSVVEIGKGIFRGVNGFIKNIAHGKIFQAFKTLVGSAVGGVIKAGTRLVSTTYNSIEKFVNGATYLLGPLGKPLRHILAKPLEFGHQIILGAWNTAVGIVKNVGEGLGNVVDGVGEILQGKFKNGFKDIAKGILKVSIQTPIDALLMGAGSTVSAIQSLTGIEPVGRKLSDHEIEKLKPIFGNSIDYSAVRIKTGSAGVFSIGPRPFVMGNTIYMKNEKFQNDSDFKVLVHEMTHVWQHQNGGTDYMSESLWSQNFGKGYEWDASIPKTPWNKLEPEQQAAFLEAAYESGFLDPTQPNYMQFFDAVQDDPQLTKYALGVLKQLHNGAGAP